MKISKAWIAASVLAALLVAAGCSMISFFPQKAAEKAADRVLDDILPGSRANGEASRPAEPKKP